MWFCSGVFWIALAIAPCALSQDEVPAAGPDGIRYTVRIEGIEQGDIRAAVEERSEALASRDKPPASYFHLDRRVRRDQERFNRVMQSLGYYAGTVRTDILTESEPWGVVFAFSLGEQFRFGEVALVRASSGQIPEPDRTVPYAAQLLALMGIDSGGPALAQVVLDGEQAALDYLRDHGYPFPEGAGRHVVVDHARNVVDVTLEIDPGPSAMFGAVRVEGLDHVREPVVLRRLSWDEGGAYALSEVEETQRRLFGTGLFSMVRIEPLPQVEQDGDVPIGIALQERKHRTFGAGLRYGTDEGIGLRGSWEHRNMRGLGERLRLQGTAAQNEIGLGAEYTFPYFRREDQSLELSLNVRQDMLDAYDSLGLDLGVRLRRKLSERLDASAGVLVKARDVEQHGDRRRFELVSTPVEATWRTGDIGMNPAKGMRVRGLVEPYFGFETTFLKSDLEWVNYLPLNRERNWVLASRLRAGLLLGASLDDVPAYERFFAGGGGSVRGYKYQSVGVLDEDDDPVGGKSILEVGVELRRKLNEKIWMVGFVDAGWAGESETPDFGDMMFGVGTGIRYMTPVGPLRLDVAIPLDARDGGIDAPLQIYLSIGQAF